MSVCSREPPESTGSSCFSQQCFLFTQRFFSGASCMKSHSQVTRSNLQAPVRLCLEMLSPDRKQKQVHIFLIKEACLCKRSKTPSTEKHRPYRKNSHLTQRQYVALLKTYATQTTKHHRLWLRQKNKNNTSV